MRSLPARRLAGFGTTIFTEMTRLAVEHGAINLAQGFPDFDGPDFVKEAAVAAIRAGRGQYARMTGMPEIHEALAAKYRRDYGLEYRVGDEITVTSGATEAIFATIQALCDPEDEVVLFEPYYDSYKASRRDGRRGPALREARGAGLGLRLRRRGARRQRVRTRADPPSTRLTTRPARCFGADELDQVARLCVERHLVWHLTDEVYERHRLRRRPPHPHRHRPGMRDRTITVDELRARRSRVTGWTIGWTMASPALSAAVRAAHQFITFATATPLQHGAACALAAGPEYYEGLLAGYRARRDYLVAELTRIGFGVRPTRRDVLRVRGLPRVSVSRTTSSSAGT